MFPSTANSPEFPCFPSVTRSVLIPRHITPYRGPDSADYELLFFLDSSPNQVR
jgi:hypothetical protein